jgi:hypothetical protein
MGNWIPELLQRKKKHADSIHQRRISILLLQQRPQPNSRSCEVRSRGSLFVVEGEVVLRESVGLKTSELARAEELASEHQQLMIHKWHEHFD